MWFINNDIAYSRGVELEPFDRLVRARACMYLIKPHEW